jgi:2-amino-4-hydroxy-6-hydroxymethyldihydropteridine diphosphokinase
MIFLGIGSNLDSSFGNRFKNLELAIAHLKTKNIKTIQKSSFYETSAYPNQKDPKFINIVIQVETFITPSELASTIISVEKILERKRNKKNDPRTCDIDIIDFNNKVLNFKYNDLDFYVPHKKMIYRSFVLYPLKDVSPYWKHPKTGELIDDLINNLKTEDKISILKIDKY